MLTPEAVEDRTRAGSAPHARFAARVLLFALPIVLAAAAIEIMLWRVGENWPIERVVAAQDHDPGAVFMRGLLNQDFFRYKLVNLRKRQPSIVVLGSSRVMRFRGPMFTSQPDRFYNAGGMLQDLDDASQFARGLEGVRTPALVVLGVDAWWLNDSRAAHGRLRTSAGADAATGWENHVAVWRRLVREPSRLKTLASAALRPRTSSIGLLSNVNGGGFRGDGSMVTTLQPAAWTFIDRESPPLPERVRRGLTGFERTDAISRQRLAQLSRVLRDLTASGATVVGFAPPISGEALAAIDADPQQKQFWDAFRRDVAALFASHDVPFIDVTSTASLGLDDTYMYDGFHAMETFHAHLVLRMLEFPRVAALLPESGRLIQTALRHPGTNRWYLQCDAPLAIAFNAH